jgi:hypothetical protein
MYVCVCVRVCVSACVCVCVCVLTPSAILDTANSLVPEGSTKC